MIKTFISNLLLLLLVTGEVLAAGVYTWVDKNGATHFSDSPPPNESVDADRIELEDAPPIEGNLPPGYFSVTRQAERLEARRLEYERIRTERLKAEAEMARAQTAADAERERKYRQDFNVGNQRYTPLYPYTFLPRAKHPHPMNRHSGTTGQEEAAPPVPIRLPVQRESHIRVR